jgi:C1A family cysteine protease|eukprot:CAMPEP_0182499302 /NCGR_PEP_ID=MMETSP1321-20130603/7467_1 /TAXON_ID=91990 /ORGANISM="Bolidomonas sp., Strain RCC1657" /LENGTH=341 /DNA_ID=CAMNT_0024703469 /DNA_START=18 /DNA_END=1043 /DNA_ORIENTATION=+
MKFALALAALAATAQALSEEASSMLLSERFEAFKAEHGKTYTGAEHKERMAVFEANVEKVAKLNSKLEASGRAPVHGVTKFADMTEDEFQFYLGVDANLKAPELPVYRADEVVVNATGSFNWNDEGKLTAVKDQQQCGSCWAFSATETVETAWAIAGNSLTEFAPQQLVSCDSVDQGCNGGLPSNAFEYIKSAGGMCTESDYPYTSGKGVTGTCTSPLPSLSGGTVSDWGYAQDKCQGFQACTEDTDAIIAALKQYGPMSIAIDASQWSSYTGGIMDSGSCSNSPRKMDHAVQLVGYNADEAYWVVRNSWNTNWGEDGFIRLKMGENTCGIANLAALIKSV